MRWKSLRGIIRPKAQKQGLPTASRRNWNFILFNPPICSFATNVIRNFSEASSDPRLRSKGCRHNWNSILFNSAHLQQMSPGMFSDQRLRSPPSLMQAKSHVESYILKLMLNQDFHAFKYGVCGLFHNPLLMRSKCEECVLCMALFVWQGFSQSIFCSPPTYGNFLMNCGNVQWLGWFWEDVEGWRGQARHVLDWSN